MCNCLPNVNLKLKYQYTICTHLLDCLAAAIMIICTAVKYGQLMSPKRLKSAVWGVPNEGNQSTSLKNVYTQ